MINGPAETLIPVLVAAPQVGPATIGAAGGVVQGSDGSLVAVPPGALPAGTPVNIAPAALGQLPQGVPDGFYYAGSFQLDVGPDTLDVPVQVAIPVSAGIPAGTEVFFFTTLGRIEQSGKTVRGIAAVNFVSDARSGRATVTAISGQAGATTNPTVEIAIGSALPARVNVAADPQRITSPRNARIVATVFDEFGNPVQNVPVSFSIGGSLIEETLDSGGALLYTNSNGQVTDTLRTRAPVGLGQKEVTVTATTANGTTGSVTVFID